MCDEGGFDEVLERIDEMLDDPRYAWATGTLEGIYEWIEDKGHVTDRQRAAVRNIEGAAE